MCAQSMVQILTRARWFLRQSFSCRGNDDSDSKPQDSREAYMNTHPVCDGQSWNEDRLAT
jgi:hypothetical protein